MNDNFSDIGNRLSDLGWRVVRSEDQDALSLPQECEERYHWLPGEVIAFLKSFDLVLSADEKAWFTTCKYLRGDIDSAFAWNQWEKLSLSSAEADGDAEWKESIRAFWDEHFPLLLSVKSGYAYIAIRKDLTIVQGSEPEFEGTAPVANDFSHFLALVAEQDSSMDPLI